MALSNLFGWNKKDDTAPAAACGAACGAGDKPEEKPAACGAGDQSVNRSILTHSVPGRGRSCREHLKCYSVNPILYKNEVKDDETVLFLSMAHYR